MGDIQSTPPLLPAGRGWEGLKLPSQNHSSRQKAVAQPGMLLIRLHPPALPWPSLMVKCEIRKRLVLE